MARLSPAAVSSAEIPPMLYLHVQLHVTSRATTRDFSCDCTFSKACLAAHLEQALETGPATKHMVRAPNKPWVWQPAEMVLRESKITTSILVTTPATHGNLAHNCLPRYSGVSTCHCECSVTCRLVACAKERQSTSARKLAIAYLGFLLAIHETSCCALSHKPSTADSSWCRYMDGMQYGSASNHCKDTNGWRTSSAPGSCSAPFNKPFGLLLNIAVGGLLPGRAPSANTAFPQTMLVGSPHGSASPLH